jgi:hypothetical protein
MRNEGTWFEYLDYLLLQYLCKYSALKGICVSYALRYIARIC